MKFNFLRLFNKCMQSSVKGLERAMKKRIVRMGSNARHVSLVTARSRDSNSTIHPFS